MPHWFKRKPKRKPELTQPQRSEQRAAWLRSQQQEPHTQPTTSGSANSRPPSRSASPQRVPVPPLPTSRRSSTDSTILYVTTPAAASRGPDARAIATHLAATRHAGYQAGLYEFRSATTSRRQMRVPTLPNDRRYNQAEMTNWSDGVSDGLHAGRTARNEAIRQAAVQAGAQYQQQLMQSMGGYSYPPVWPQAPSDLLNAAEETIWVTGVTDGTQGALQ